MLKNTEARYGVVSKGLHWLIALLIVGLIWLGWYMVDLTYFDRWYNSSLSLHKSLGIIVLSLGAMKIGWTLYSRAPDYTATIKAWEKIAARLTHLTLNFMLLAIPATGYLVSTSEGKPVSMFNVFDVPALMAVNEELRDLAIDLHYYFAYGAAFLVGLHALAALKHQFIDKNDTLKRML